MRRKFGNPPPRAREGETLPGPHKFKKTLKEMSVEERREYNRLRQKEWRESAAGQLQRLSKKEARETRKREEAIDAVAPLVEAMAEAGVEIIPAAPIRTRTVNDKLRARAPRVNVTETLAAMAQGGTDYLRILDTVARDEATPTPQRLSALTLLLNYQFGKPVTPTEVVGIVDVTHRIAREMTDDELREAVAMSVDDN